jgi:glycosyltransferase involved in cell wall biosynthesis
LAALPVVWWRLARAFRAVDVVQVHDLRGVILGAPAAVLARRKLVVHVHARSRAWRVASFVLIRASVPVIAPSRRFAAAWAGSLVGRVVELPNPVAAAPASVEGAVPLVVALSRLHPDKGISDLLDAMDILAERGIAVQLVVAGADAPGWEQYGAALRARAAASGHTTMPGNVADVSTVLSGAWVFVHPSLHEALPMAVLEAAACGLPVVATDVGGVADVVEDGVTGLLVAPSDPVALADALERLLVAPDERRRYGRAARAKVAEQFSHARFAAVLRETYAVAR